LFAGVRPPVRRPLLVLLAALAATAAGSSRAASAQAAAPGGFLETAPTSAVRPLLTAAQIQSLLPARGRFTFPAPYLTTGIRISNATDCGGSDCVNYVGYSYWRNMNNHVGSNTMLVFLGLDRSRGGPGPSLFTYDKTTDQVQNAGPLFAPADPLSWESGEGWYWSATQPNTLYVHQTTGSQLLRYDAATGQVHTVFDVAPQFGSDRYIWQPHSSNDDRVHSATLKQQGTWDDLGCVVYREDTGAFTFYPKGHTYDECQIDKSGRYLLIKQNVTGANGEDNVIVDLQTGTQRVLTDQQGAGGHSDTGHGHVVAADNWYSQPNTTRLWNLATNPITQSGSVVYYGTDWNVEAPAHVSWTNARAGVPVASQYACGSSASAVNSPLANEIFCFMLDGSMHLLVVAPVMTGLGAAGGGSDAYAKMPKGNLDVTGQYFIWTSNMRGARLDAFIVKVPSDLLTGLSTPSGPPPPGPPPPGPPPDTTPPTVSLTAPASGAAVSGTVTVSASASDNVGVVGVQFKLDGANLGAEDTTAPYSVAWNTTAAAAGSHTLTAVARDAAGRVTTSVARTVTVSNGLTQAVVWTSLVRVTATGNSLRKTLGCDGCLDAGAVSQQRISSGNGSVSFTASETATLRYAGLSRGNGGTGANEIAFAVRLQAGIAEVREKGRYRADTPFVPGDVFTIQVENGTVRYLKNGSPFYTSRQRPSYPLLVDSSLASLDATITSAVMSGIK
jgi:hypothetical protein